MACPNTEDGFVMIAVELGAALAMADLSRAEQVIVWEVIAQTYGPTKAANATVSASDLQKRTGMDRSYLAKSLKQLVESHVLSEGRAKGTYKLQKNYDRWDRACRKETADESKARREYARASVKLARVARESSPEEAPEGCGCTATAPCGCTATEGVVVQPQPCGCTATAILLEEFKSIKKQQQTAAESEQPGAESDDDSEPFHPPTLPMPVPPPASAAQPTPADDIDAAVARIEAFIRDSGTNPLPFECKVRSLVIQYPARWVELAIRDAIPKSTISQGPMGLVLRMLKAWDKCDGPENDPMYSGEKPKPKSIPLPPEVKAPKGWDQPGEANPFSRYNRSSESA